MSLKSFVFIWSNLCLVCSLGSSSTSVSSSVPSLSILRRTTYLELTNNDTGKGNEPAELVGKMDFAEEIMGDLGCDFYFIPVRRFPPVIWLNISTFWYHQHKDLHEHIYTLCTNAGVDIRHEFEVIEVISRTHLKSGGPTVVGKSGERITGDIVSNTPYAWNAIWNYNITRW